METSKILFFFAFPRCDLLGFPGKILLDVEVDEDLSSRPPKKDLLPLPPKNDLPPHPPKKDFSSTGDDQKKVAGKGSSPFLLVVY